MVELFVGVSALEFFHCPLLSGSRHLSDQIPIRMKSHNLRQILKRRIFCAPVFEILTPPLHAEVKEDRGSSASNSFAQLPLLN